MGERTASHILKTGLWWHASKGITTEKIERLYPRSGSGKAAYNGQSRIRLSSGCWYLAHAAQPSKVSAIPHFPRLAEGNVEGF